MSYAQGTTHYNLPQTQGDDQRDWFDTNQAFNDVDSTLFAAAEGVQTLDKDLSTVKTELASAQKDITDIQTHDANYDIKVSALETLTTQHSTEIVDVRQDCEDMVCALEEPSATAKYNHEVGSYFRYNNTLYVTTVKINANDTIVPNVNCKTTDIVSELGGDGDQTLPARITTLETEVSTLNTTVGKGDLSNYGANLVDALQNSKIKAIDNEIYTLDGTTWKKITISNSTPILSTTPIAIGTDLTGKTIYRQTFQLSAEESAWQSYDNVYYVVIKLMDKQIRIYNTYGYCTGTDSANTQYTWPISSCHGTGSGKPERWNWIETRTTASNTHEVSFRMCDIINPVGTTQIVATIDYIEL